MKTCGRCGLDRPLDNFTKRVASPDGLNASCQNCVSRMKRYRRDVLRARSDEEIDAAAAARGPRTCYRCSTVKDPDDFPRDRGRPDGRAQYCKPCSAANTIKYRTVISPELYRARKKAEFGRNRETYRRHRLKKSFGLTLEEYRDMVEAQGGVCYICKRPEVTDRRGRVIDLAVDHDHATGQVRHLLCGNCNKGLGNFQDSPELLASAILYLRSHRLRAVQ